MSSWLKNQYQRKALAAMGIPFWISREYASSLGADTTTPNTQPWEQLKNTVSNCQQCALAQSRTQTVFGVGNCQADLLVVGEAPGFHEDKQGEPFVGRAGQLLNAMLRAINLTRETIYIANVLKCRPPQNRDPKPEEVAKCTPFLEAQVAHIQPKVILALGRVAAHYLLGVETPLARMRNKPHQFKQTGIPLVVTYHPAYLLRNPIDKGKALQDLLLVQKTLLQHEK